MRYLIWLQEQRFDHPAHQIALQEMVDAVRVSKERVNRLEKVIEEFIPNWSLAPVVLGLQALRGVDLIVAVTFATEIGDVSRFESPRQLMGYLGLVPGERSTGETTKRGGITKAGNSRVRTLLVESAWTYRFPPAHRLKEALQARERLITDPRDRIEDPNSADRTISRADLPRKEIDRSLHSDCA